jgi:hypothetical protein
MGDIEIFKHVLFVGMKFSRLIDCLIIEQTCVKAAKVVEGEVVMYVWKFLVFGFFLVTLVSSTVIR